MVQNDRKPRRKNNNKGDLQQTMKINIFRWSYNHLFTFICSTLGRLKLKL